MFIGDLHIHSRYSRATSKDGIPEYLELWARKKGIQVIGTGDFTHPAWRKELEEKLDPAEDGLYRLKEEYRIKAEGTAMESESARFIVSGEISSIYKKGGRVRKVHSLLLLPGLEEADRLSAKLEAIGNIHSDGRPILGLDCRDLLEIMLDICPSGMLIPAHIWTPHFSMFGAFSGFNTVEECFGDMTPYIHALETGLSSDPPMNWRLSALDAYQLISNSDAHSPAKLGREANLFETELSYEGLKRAIETGEGLKGTIEFFPEEGKYHYDGHRKCNICFSPSQTEEHGGKCPVCGRKLTIGVDHRVEQLADRNEGYIRQDGKPYESLVPLPEVIGASTGRSSAGTAVGQQYERLIGSLGAEFKILREVPIEEIRKEAGYLISEGIRRLRDGQVKRMPGFDGEYGTIKLFEPGEIDNLDGQMSLFAGFGLDMGESSPGEEEPDETVSQDREEKPVHRSIDREEIGINRKDSEEKEMDTSRNKAEEDGYIEAKEEYPITAGEEGNEKVEAQEQKLLLEKEGDATDNDLFAGLNEAQQKAVQDVARVIAVTAGPGTGKTRTLTARILWLLQNRKIKTSQITAVTFTRKAAEEMKERLKKQLGARNAGRIHIGTFHAICFGLLSKQREFVLADESAVCEAGEETIKRFGLKETSGQFLRQVSLWKNKKRPEDGERDEAFFYYDEWLHSRGLLDFDDLLLEALKLAEGEEWEDKRFSYLLVDEFQDISPIQYELLQAWNKKGRELFVIGDTDQAIYGFRGADTACFERLEADWKDKGREGICLKENYRSFEPIVKGAGKVISKNPGPERDFYAVKGAGMPIRLMTDGSNLSDAIFIAREINRLVGGIDMLDSDYEDQTFSLLRTAEGDGKGEAKARSFGDIAVLYRTHRQAALLEKCLRKEGIPYVVMGREEFLEEKAVRGTIAFFRSLLIPDNGFFRQTALKLLWNFQEEEGSALVYETMAEKYRKTAKREKPQKLLETWIGDLGLEEDEGMEKFASMAVFHKNMEDFLEQLAFGRESDLKRCGGKTYHADSVTLMTLHGSKGLEFPVVMIYGAKKGLIPLENSRKETDEEEERRLFYVGMTRAMEELVLCCGTEPSPFTEDIPVEVCLRERAGKRKREKGGVQMSLFDFM
ncbi:UvrD-helicase domain-containing protein [Lachnospiraceae bacterium 62-35]